MFNKLLIVNEFAHGIIELHNFVNLLYNNLLQNSHILLF